MDDKEFPTQLDESHSSPFDRIETLVEYLQKEKIPVNVSKMVKPTTKLIAFGEVHMREGAKREVIDNLQVLRGIGFTHLGMEMFTVDQQPVLDEYQTNGSRRGEIETMIANSYGNYSPNAGKLYLSMLDRAIQVGIHVVALDLPKSERTENTIEMQAKRDRLMADTVKGILTADPNNRMIAYTGTYHALKSETIMAGILEKEGIETITVGIQGGRTEKSQIDFAVQKAGITDERFMFPVRAKVPDTAPPVDWVIHLPENEPETDIEKLSGSLENYFKPTRAEQFNLTNSYLPTLDSPKFKIDLSKIDLSKFVKKDSYEPKS